MLSRTTEYALRALVYIQLMNWEGQRPGIPEIAENIESPRPFTAKVLQQLARQGLIRSMKGRGGGFFFDEGKASLSLYEIIIVMEGPGFFQRCGFGLKDCSDERPCPLHGQYAFIRDGFRALVESESIQSLAREVSEGRAVLSRGILEQK